MVSPLWPLIETPYRRLSIYSDKFPFTFKSFFFTFYFKLDVLLLFLHNSYGTPEFRNCWNLVGAYWMENLRWDHMEPYEPYRWVHTEPFMQFRKANMEPSMHFRKANTEPSMHFRRDNTEFLYFNLQGKNLHWLVSPMSYLQTSSGNNFCQDAFG